MVDFELRDLTALVAFGTLFYTIYRHAAEDKSRAKLKLYDHSILDRLRPPLDELAKINKKIVEKIHDPVSPALEKVDFLTRVFDGEIMLHLNQLAAVLENLKQSLSGFIVRRDFLALVEEGRLIQLHDDLFDRVQVGMVLELEEMRKNIIDLSRSADDENPYPDCQMLNNYFIELETLVAKFVGEIQQKIMVPTRPWNPEWHRRRFRQFFGR